VAPGYLNDVLSFDYPSMTWSDISGVVSGVKQVEKFSCGLLVQDGKLYIHGGANDAGVDEVVSISLFFVDPANLILKHKGFCFCLEKLGKLLIRVHQLISINCLLLRCQRK
jgi:hypothetical protein